MKNARGEWITAAPIPGTFVCNVGDMLRIYSNGEAFPPACLPACQPVLDVFSHAPKLRGCMLPVETCGSTWHSSAKGSHAHLHS